MQRHLGQPHQRATAAAWGILVAVSVARFAFGYQMQTVASLGPLLVATFHLDFAALGTLVGLYMLPGIAAALGLGFLAQRLGERSVMAGGMLLMTLGGIAAALAHGPTGIGVGRVIAGAGAVALTVLQGKVLADRFQGRSFMLSLGLMLGSFPIGIGVGQLTHGALAHAFGWPAAFLAGAVPSAVAGAVLLLTWPAAERGGRRAMSWPSRPECVLVLLAGLIWTFYTAGFVAFLTYTPTLMHVRGQPAWVTDAVMNAATWGNLPAILFGGALATRFGASRVFAAGMLLAVVSVAAMPFSSWPLFWGSVYGTVGAMHGTVIVAAGTLSARPQHRAVGMGLFYSVYYVGSTIFPAVCGRFADLVGDPSGAFLCGAAISTLAFPAWALHRWRLAAAARTRAGLIASTVP